MTDIVVTAQNDSIVAVNALDLEPDAMIVRVTKIANILKSVIEQQKMFFKFGEKKHVTIDGWNTLGSLLSILPAENSVKKIEGGYEAKVDLVNKNSGIIVGSASAICLRSERNWEKRDDYAIRSMAVTRATGKAYRLAFSWIVTLAGYEPTPAEEMPHELLNSTNSVHSSAISKKENKAASAGQPQADRIYNNSSKDQQTALAKALEKKEIPAHLWEEIGKQLDGKDKSFLDETIFNVLHMETIND